MKYTKNALPKKMIFMVNGFLRHGGLSDRLRGALSTYLYAKKNGMDFSIYWNSPFPLSDYLIPNKVNWRMHEDEISYVMPDVLPIYVGSYYKRFNTSAEEERKLQYKWLDDAVKKTKSATQYHVYSNAHFCDTEYKTLFEELFMPSEHIIRLLNNCKYNIGSEFIAASFRFMQLLGDFEDRCGGEKLSAQQKEEIIADALQQLHILHIKHPNLKVLVTSDSTVFATRVNQLPFVYIIPGEISHIDAKSQSTKSFDKEFLDLLLLSKAKCIYRYHRAPMHYSGFPLTAAQIGGIKVETIEF